MRPHPRIRKTIKWGGAAVTVLLTLVLLVDICWNDALETSPRTDLDVLGLAMTDARSFAWHNLVIEHRGGFLSGVWIDINRPLPPLPPSEWSIRQGSDMRYARRRAVDAALLDKWSVDRWRRTTAQRAQRPTAGQIFQGSYYASIPTRQARLGLGILILVVGGATLYGWLRRPSAGMCPSCNYDRTGLAPGAVCPECGSASPALPS